MTLAASATALLTLVRAYNSGATFTTTNSSYGDWLVLDATGTEVSAVVEMADVSVSGDIVQDGAVNYGTQGNYQEAHTLAVFVAYKRGVGASGDGALYSNLTTLVDALRAYLTTYPRLNNAGLVRYAHIVQTSTPFDVAPSQPNDAPSTHLAQRLIVKVWCETTPAFVERG